MVLYQADRAACRVELELAILLRAEVVGILVLVPSDFCKMQRRTDMWPIHRLRNDIVKGTEQDNPNAIRAIGDLPRDAPIILSTVARVS
jgi:hypothetical protein